MNEFFICILVLRGSNGFIYRKILFGDRVPLRTSPGAHVFFLMLFMNVPSPNMTTEYEISGWSMVHHEAGARVGVYVCLCLSMFVCLSDCMFFILKFDNIWRQSKKSGSKNQFEFLARQVVVQTSFSFWRGIW